MQVKTHMLMSTGLWSPGLGEGENQDTSYILSSPVLPSSALFSPSPLPSPLFFLAAVFFPLPSQLVHRGFILPSPLHVLCLTLDCSPFFFAWLDAVCSFGVVSHAAFPRELPLFPRGWSKRPTYKPPFAGATLLWHFRSFCSVWWLPGDLCLSPAALRAPWRQASFLIPPELYAEPGNICEWHAQGLCNGPLARSSMSTSWRDEWVKRWIYCSHFWITHSTWPSHLCLHHCICVRLTCIWGCKSSIL